MARDKDNLFAGFCLAAFGIYLITAAVKLPYVSEVGPGPGFFPLWIGIGMVAFASILMLASFFPSGKIAKNQSPSWLSAGRVLAGWAALMLAIALLGQIGFIASFVLLTLFLLIALDRRPALLAVGVGIGLAAAFQLIFVIALDVSLPKGFLGF